MTLALRSVVAIAKDEVRARGRLLVVAAVLGVLPLALPWFVDGRLVAGDPGRLIAAGSLLALVTVVLAPLLGGAALSGVGAGRSLAFYLLRPLGVPVLVAGKVVGGMLVLLAAQVLVAAPAVLVDRQLVTALAWRGHGLWSAVAAVGLAGVGVFAVGLSGALMVRLRSWVVLVDAAAATVWVGMVAVGLHRWGFWMTLSGRGSWHASPATVAAGQSAGTRLLWLLGAGLVVLTAIWLVVTAVAIDRGRSDDARIHRWLSLVAWPVGLVVTALLVLAPDAVAGREREDPPGWVSAIGGGGWIALGDPRERPSFLHPASGRFRSAPFQLWQSHLAWQVVFAAAAPRVAWLQRRAGWRGEPGWGPASSIELVSVDLERGDSPPARVMLDHSPLHGLVLSPDGQRALVLLEGNAGQVMEVDLGTGAVRRHQVAGQGRLEAARFLDGDTAHLFRAVADGDDETSSRRWEIHALDLEGGALRLRGIMSGSGARRWQPGSGGGPHLLWGPTMVSSHHPATGATLDMLPLRPGDRHAALPLADGSLATVRWSQGTISVLRGQAGQWSAPLELGKLARLGYLAMAPVEMGPGRVYVSWAAQPAPPLTTLPRALVDLNTGQRLPLPDDLVFVAERWQPWAVPAEAGTAQLLSGLAMDTRGERLFLYDRDSDRRRQLMGPVVAPPVSRHR